MFLFSFLLSLFFYVHFYFYFLVFIFIITIPTADSKTVFRLLDGLESANKIKQIVTVLPKGINMLINKNGITGAVNSTTAVETINEVKILKIIIVL